MMKVTIIIRAYNAEKTIERAVKSALDQNFLKSQYEVLIINDGSTDRTLDILNKFNNTKNLRIKSTKNKGPISAANMGFQMSKGTYLILLDSDDEFPKNTLRQMVKVMDNSKEVDFVYSNYYEVRNGKKKLVVPKNIFETVAAGIMFRRKNLLWEGSYTDGVFFAEYDLLLRTVNKWRFHHLESPLFIYNRSKTSLSANNQNIAFGIEQLKTLHPKKWEYIRKIRPY